MTKNKTNPSTSNTSHHVYFSIDYFAGNNKQQLDAVFIIVHIGFIGLSIIILLLKEFLRWLHHCTTDRRKKVCNKVIDFHFIK